MWKQDADLEDLRNTLIAAMVDRMSFGVQNLQATDTETLLTLVGNVG